LHADASGGQPVLSIINVCAANLIGKNLVREMGLLSMPYTNWTRCGDWPDHPKPLEEWYQHPHTNIVATAETWHPEDAGTMKLIRFLDQAIAR
jgi:hypothetical protein